MTPFTQRGGESERRALPPWEDPRWVTRVQSLSDDLGVEAPRLDEPPRPSAKGPHDRTVQFTAAAARTSGEGSGATGATAPAGTTTIRLLEATAQAAMIAAGLAPCEREEMLALAHIHPDDTSQRHAYAWIIALLDGKTLPTR